jgi:NAD-dependent dihydropyrimidine dehydrogenase PreA subunit
MIELIFDDRCTACGECVAVCPGFVFDVAPDGHPVIARPVDCQTCFHCELHCRADALFVAPQVAARVGISPDAARPLLGQFRRESGWHEFASDPRYSNDHWRMDGIFGRARAAQSPTGATPP